jgi:hypothetical protein
MNKQTLVYLAIALGVLIFADKIRSFPVLNKVPTA